MNYFEIQKHKDEKKEKAFIFAIFLVFFAASSMGFSSVFAVTIDEENYVRVSETEVRELTEAEKIARKIAQAEAEKAAQAQREKDAEDAKKAEEAARVEREAQALRDKISNKNNELEDIKATIDAYTKQVEVVHGETKTLQGAVKSLDLDRQKMSSSIKLTENRLESTNLNIDRLGLEIVDTENKIVSSEDAIAEVLRTTEQAESRSIVETILAKSNLSEILDESFQLGQFRSKVSAHTQELKKFKEDRLAKKTEREGEKKKLVGYKVELVDKKVILDNARKEQKELLAVTKNKETTYRKILDENIAKKEAFEKELFEYENQLKRQLDQKYIPEAGSKILMWPLDVIRITQHFGKTKDSARLYSSGTHNGMDFAANRGTPVKAPAGGVVIGIGDTDKACPKGSYGKWVLIKHNNGLTTLFAHLDLIKVAEGQSVSIGDVFAYTGNTGYSTGPHLHLTLFASEGVQIASFASKSCSGKSYTMPLPTAKNAYLDPEAYF
jgi:murein DD-endopeptidase MepM/ murein hydrolase activator NlpD